MLVIQLEKKILDVSQEKNVLQTSYDHCEGVVENREKNSNVSTCIFSVKAKTSSKLVLIIIILRSGVRILPLAPVACIINIF